MTDLPFMKLYWQDFLADTDHLSLAELGFYVRILGKMWLSEDATVKRTLCERIAKASQELYPETVYDLLINDNGRWTQKRLRREWHEARKRSRAATDAAKSRWDKEKNAVASNPHMRIACQPEPEPDINKKQEKRRPTLEAALARSRQEFLKTNPLVNQKPNGSARQNYPQSLGAIIGTGVDRPKGGPDYDDPAVRKQRWQQKLDNWLTGALGLESKFVVELWQRHEAGDPDAVKAINGFAADMKAEEEAIRARQQ